MDTNSLQGIIDITLRLLAAAILGGMIGLERDIHGREAGLRTHLLVSTGSAVFMIISILTAQNAGVQINIIRADPGRIAAQIVTGIGFLGAGAIIKEGASIRGLTTAACLWIAAGLGMASGGGYYIIATLATGISLLSLIGLKRIEKIYLKDSYRTLVVKTPLKVKTSDIIDQVKQNQLTILNCEVEKDYINDSIIVKLSIRLFNNGITDKLAHNIIDGFENSKIPITNIQWRQY